MVASIQQYGMPVLLAVTLHALLGLWLNGVWAGDDDPASRFIKPVIVHSTLLVMEPKPKPRAPVKAAAAKPAADPNLAAKRAQETKRQEAARQEQVRQEQVRQEQARQDQARQELARQKADDERRAREQRLAALADSAFLSALEDETSELAEDAAVAAEVAAQSYRYGIYQRIVANWSRPPSARNGMQARLRVDLVPTGEVVAVTLLESSGSGAFDQSAEAAVKKARRFEVPPESAMFEKYFRRFTLLFKPEDLLR